MEVSLKVVNPLKTSVMAMKHLVQNNNNGDENPPKGVYRDIKLLIKHVDKMERGIQWAYGEMEVDVKRLVSVKPEALVMGLESRVRVEPVTLVV